MVEISQRISMTSRAAARFSTMEDMLGSLGVWGGFCLRAILVGKRILSGIDAVSRGTVRDRSAGGVGFRAILLKTWKELCWWQLFSTAESEMYILSI